MNTIFFFIFSNAVFYIRPIPCACKDPSQHFLLYVLSGHKQALLVRLGDVLLGVLKCRSLFFGIIYKYNFRNYTYYLFTGTQLGTFLPFFIFVPICSYPFQQGFFNAVSCESQGIYQICPSYS